MTHADWYFDFISPFSYLQLEQFDRLPAGVDVALKPIVFAALLTHHDHKGPAEIAAKRRFTYRHVLWTARHMGIPLRFPDAHPFNPIKLLRLAIVCGCERDAIRAIFRYVWRDGRSADDTAAFEALARTLGIIDVEARINAQSIKDRLRANGEEAIARGVFGVPTFAIGSELFWGADATQFVIDFLENPALLDEAEMRRVSDLPVASARS
jgi:2-hydroxychromene-2-carboxylate isomerase